MTGLIQGRFSNVAVVQPGAPPRRSDWVISGVLLLLVIVELWLKQAQQPILGIASATVAIGLLPWRRQYPLHITTIAFAAEATTGLLTTPELAGQLSTFGHLGAGLMLVYALCRWLPPPQVALGLGLVAMMVFLSELHAGASVLDSVSFLVPWLILTLIALAMRYRARLIVQHHEQVRLNERTALARELHDTVAHHVSAIAVQAQAAQFVSETDPSAALKAIRTIEAVANQTIEEMHRVVGLLRSEEQDLELAHPHLQDLVDPSGNPAISLHGDTEMSALPREILDAVYRIAQESITNARNHTTGLSSIDITIGQSDQTLELKIQNDGSPSPRTGAAGFGLIGMRERTDALGGTFQSGPCSPSGWYTSVSLPLRKSSAR